MILFQDLLIIKKLFNKSEYSVFSFQCNITVILLITNFSNITVLFCIFDQIYSGLMSIRNLSQKQKNVQTFKRYCMYILIKLYLR